MTEGAQLDTERPSPHSKRLAQIDATWPELPATTKNDHARLACSTRATMAATPHRFRARRDPAARGFLQSPVHRACGRTVQFIAAGDSLIVLADLPMGAQQAAARLRCATAEAEKDDVFTSPRPARHKRAAGIAGQRDDLAHHSACPPAQLACSRAITISADNCVQYPPHGGRTENGEHDSLSGNCLH